MADKAKVSNTYKFAYQKNVRKPIHVYTVKEDDPEQIYSFCRRIAEVRTMTDLSFSEIHRIEEGGGISIIWEGQKGQAWPKGAKTITHDGIISRRRDEARRQTKIDTSNKQLPKIETPKGPATPGLLSKELADTNVAFTLPLKIMVA